VADADQIAERLVGCEALHRLRFDSATFDVLPDAGSATAGG
jgi:hypothetical protein